MNNEVEIRVYGKDIRFYHNDDLIYESEITARNIFMIEGLLAALDYSVLINDLTPQENNEQDEPTYEEISFIDSEE